MELDLQTHQKYTKYANIALWSLLGLIVALSIINGMIQSELVIRTLRFVFGVFMLAGSGRSALFASSPKTSRVPVMLRIVYGFMLAFLLFIGALWLMLNALFG
jgi:hypothetical protein